MRIVFMGTPEYSIPSLEALNEVFEVVGVYTQPDKKSGRKMLLQEPPVKKRAKELGLPVYQPFNFRDEASIKELEALKPDFLAVVAYGIILPKSVLSIPKYGAVNAHGSILPMYRGASPMQEAVKNGDLNSGVTTMLMDEGLDTGDMLLKEEVEIKDLMISDVHDKLAELSARLFVKTFREFNSIKPIPQDDNKASITKKISREDGYIEWGLSQKDIIQRFRAYYPWPGITVMIEGKRLKIHAVSPVEDETSKEPGTVINIDKMGIIISVADGLIRLEKVQPEGKKVITAYDYHLGYNLKKGDKL